MAGAAVQGFRLSPQQRRLWSVQDGVASPAFQSRCAVLIEGGLDPTALQRALDQAVERHEILRTTFSVPPGMTTPLQVVGDGGGVPLATLPADSPEALLDGFAETSGLTLDQGPLPRAALVPLEEGRHLLLIALPALCADRAGLRSLVRELALSYAACLGGPALDEPLQYADLSEWQNELLEADETAAGRAYWQRMEIAEHLAAGLPFESRPEAAAPRMVSLPVALAPAAAERAAALGLSPAALLLAAWQAVLARLTGREEVLVGAQLDGRRYGELKELVGLFARCLPAPGRVEPGATLREAAAAAAQRLAEVHEWQESFAWPEALAAEGAAAPFFPFGFEVEAEPEEIAAAGVRLRIVAEHACSDRFKVRLRARQSGPGLAAWLDYDAGRLPAAEVERLGAQLARLIENALAAPDVPLADLDSLGDAERRLVVEAANATAFVFPGPAEDCFHHLFEEQADRRPAEVAVVDEASSLTYAELEARANRLAHHLRRLGAAPDALVALLLERSVELPVAVLGVMKAGGAYLPLDPGLPRERLGLILKESGARIVVSEEALAGLLPQDPGRAAVLVDASRDAIARESGRRPAGRAVPGNLAYVIFTSGSTGAPKGVAVEHRQLVHYVRGVSARLGFQPGAAYASVSTLAADLGNTMVFPALAVGGRLHLPARQRLADPEALARFFDRHPIDALKIVPSHLAALLGASGGERVLPRRWLVLGGEAAAPELLERLRQLAPGCSLYNHYGPTEATVGVLTHSLHAGEEGGVPALGKPLPNSRVYLCDAHLRPVPLWVAGELLIGGAGVARGYLGRPDLTAERFIPDPFAAEPGGRLYRTGDLARRTGDGNVHFLGRIDQQVKVRGFRIEPREIEAALERHPAVARSLVRVWEESPGDRRLAAYVVPHPGESVAVAALRAHLAETLPDYMIPSAFIPLAALPLTPNGKVDVRALPEPSAASREPTARVAPGTPVEEVVAGIWCEVLGLDTVGVQESFFDLGGHSLLATQVISRVRKTFDADILLSALFENPTVAGLSSAVDAALKAGQLAQEPPLERVPRDGSELPLSFAQQRLWFLDQLEPGSPLYHIPGRVRLVGRLDAAALARTLTEIVRRHEPLRTTFPARGGKPAQSILPAAEVPLPVVDLRALPEELREEAARGLARREARRPFDLSRDTLFRPLLLRLAEEEHIAVLVLHHIIADGWSMGVMVKEISLLYDHFTAGTPWPLPELPIQYADFSAWQRRWLDGEVLEAQLAYWRGRLEGCPPDLELPLDRPRAAVRSPHGATVERALPRELSQALAAFTRQQSATVFMTLLAAFDVVLSRHSGHTDVPVGTPIANRNRCEIEGLIGFFVNTLVLRSDLGGDPDFRELLGRVRDSTLGAYVHQDLPFEKLVDELKLRRDLSRTPLFQVAFVLQNAPRPALELPGLTLHYVDFDPGTAKFDLTLTVTELDSGFQCALEHSTALLDGVTASRLLGHFETLLAGIAADPGRRLSLLPMLPEAERQQLLAEGNGGTTVTYPVEATLSERFERHARRAPGAPAVVCGDERLSYGELNARANRLAHYLRARGVGPDVPVALCLDRSVDLVVAVLAVLKAGGAYVPLDPGYPAERLAFLLADTGAPVLITAEAPPEGLPVAGLEHVRLDSCRDEVAGEPESDPAPLAAPENLAYVIYTSGSTGRPKGVLVTHANVVRLFDATEAWFRFGPQDVWTLFHSYAFDFSVWEIWGPLLYGGSLVVVPYWVSRTPEAFLDLLAAEKVTALNQTPSAFRQLIAADTADAAAAEAPRDLALRFVVFGGEALELQSLAPWYARRGDRSPLLVNMYGITETTVHVTCRALSAADLEGGGASVLGGPIPDLQAYLLDRHGELVPRGAAGEIHVGGAGLARGYLGRPELTAQRFVPDPFGGRPGARLYRSGDLARLGRSGDLEYLGRIDHQVKVRGFRIELGEIEAALARHPAVRESVVLARADGPGGERRLVAYTVPAPGPALDTAELRQALRRELPKHMIPAAFVILERLPLTGNGKLDRAALPAPDAVRPVSDPERAAPRNPVEERLAEIWMEVLGLTQVGIHDNFFELGGDSILSIQIVSRANQSGLCLVPKDLFQHQTIAELAALAENTAAARTARTVVAEQGAVTGDVPLTPIQRWFFEQELAEPHHWNQAVLLETRERLDPARLAEVLRHLLAHHDALRLRFTRGEAGWRQVNATPEPEAPAPLTVLDLTGLVPAAQAHALAAAAAEVHASLDLAAGPLVRVALFDLGPGRPGRLLIVVHHLAVDGVSWRVLLEDLESGYRQLGAGQPVQLPPKTLSFRDWARQQELHAKSPRVQAELGYWTSEARNRLRPLPLDRPIGANTGANTEASAASVSAVLDAAATRQLLQEVPAAYNTRIGDALLAALVQAFAAWTGERRLLVDLEGHGREGAQDGADLSRTVGWFTALFPVLVDASEAQGPGEMLVAVKEQLRAVPEQGVGYGLLRYLSGAPAVEAALAALPVAGVSFNYLGQLDRVLAEGSPFAPAPEPAGPAHSPRGERHHLLGVTARVSGECLHVSWSYSANLHDEATVRRLADGFLSALRGLIEHCLSPEAGGCSPSDFPLARLGQAELDRILAEVDFEPWMG